MNGTDISAIVTPAQRFGLLAAGVVGTFFLTRNTFIRAFVLGFSLTYFLKYGVFGLQQWDTWFHPERLQADTTGPYKAFSKPLLQAVWSS